MTWSLIIKTVGSRSLLPTTATTATATAAAASTASPPTAVAAAAPRTSSLSSDVNSTAYESRAALASPPGDVTTATTPILKSDVSDSNNLNRSAHSASDTAESNFTIQVDPDSCISSLHAKIESVTGLTAAQQRLIYRGRIINAEGGVGAGTDGGRSTGAGPVSTGSGIGNEGVAATSSSAAGALSGWGANTASSSSEDSVNNDDTNTEAAVVAGYAEPETETTTATSPPGSQQPSEPPQPQRRIRDVTGLCDGHTIHLVPRPLPSTSSTSPSNGGGRSANIGGILSGLAGDGSGDGVGGSGGVASLSGADGMSLLAALLGLSGSGGSIGGGGSDGLAGLAGLGLGVVEEESGGTSATLGLAGGRGGLLGIGTDPTGRAAGGTRGTAARESELFPRLAPLGGTRRILRRNNRNRARSRARLTQADIRVPDPGTVEPVRQGLMTLHTLLGNALLQQENTVPSTVQRLQESKEESEEEEKIEAAADSATEDLLPLDSEATFSSPASTNVTPHPTPLTTVRSPLESHRQWYRGQWLDALDTVNQWLEATVVDIVLPSDILPHYTISSESSPRPSTRLTPRRRFRRRIPDAVVSANDLEGRRRLLLEPRPESEDGVEGNDSFGLMDEGYRERDDNEGVQLLLIHYNGWPHRWDEWIRSDSERIRPFRTRTRHRNTNQHASPTPQAIFQAAPATHIMDEDDELERASLLPELQRVITSVNNVISAAMPANSRASSEVCASNNTDTSHLPWRLPNHGIETIINSMGDDSSDVSNQSLATLYRRADPRSQLDCARLRQLAPLIDRLGRTLTDAAPHIAALADSLPSTRGTPSRTEALSNNGIGSRASHLFFGSGDAADGQGPTSAINQSATANPASAVSADADADADADAENDTINDPDLTDYINGMVNTTRGESRTERTSTRDPIGSSLLASYLSQAGGGSGSGSGSSDGNDEGNSDSPRVIRVGGGSGGSGSGPGIDIHIHAIVTGPGMNSFSLGGFGGGGGAGTSPTTATTTATTIPVATAIDVGALSSGNSSGFERVTDTADEQNRQDDEDHDLFSELYTQSPSPINLHGTSTSNDAENDIETEGVLEDSCISLTQQFVDCHDEESDVDVADGSDRPFTTSFNNDPLDNEGTVTDDDSVTQAITLAPVLNNTRDHASARASSEHGSARTGTTSLESSATAPLPQTDINRSPSFTNRLFRRTIGRLSNSNRRPSPSP